MASSPPGPSSGNVDNPSNPSFLPEARKKAAAIAAGFKPSLQYYPPISPGATDSSISTASSAPGSVNPVVPESLFMAARLDWKTYFVVNDLCFQLRKLFSNADLQARIAKSFGVCLVMVGE
jgi:hypothetical protein